MPSQARQATTVSPRDDPMIYCVEIQMGMRRFRGYCNRAVLLLFMRLHDMLLFPALTYEYAKRGPHCTPIYYTIVTYTCTCTLTCNAALLA